MALAGNVTALCVALLSGPCSTYASSTGLFAATPSQATCENFYAGIPLGLDSDKNGNTIGCRQHFATAATATSAYYCQYASLVGGGVCGLALNNTCNAVHKICNGVNNYPFQTGGYDACYTNLTALNATFGSLQGPVGGTENSLECRAYHATAYVSTGNDVHCGHVSSAGPCVDPVTTNVSHYCGLTELTCSGTAYQQYFGPDAATQWTSCTAIAKVWPTGPFVFGASNADLPGHQYHISANANLGGNTVHCSHGGPSGGGHVGTTWQAWSQAAQTDTCKNGNGTAWVYKEVGEALLDWPMQLAQVVTADADPQAYAVSPVSTAGANTETCRIYHLTAAATSAAAAAIHCVHGSIIGGGACGANPAATICSLIATACPSNYASSTACQAAILPYLNMTMMGNPCIDPAHPPTDDSLACRIFYTTLALIEVGQNKTASAANCMNAKVDGATGCGKMAAPTSGAAPVAASAFVSFLMLLW